MSTATPNGRWAFFKGHPLVMMYFTYLPVFVGYVAEKAVRIGKALRAGALSYAHYAVLFRMQYTALP